jgi:peptidoglycan/xylan/chitin deacetylase (PgdA/CDA1 family)/tetratricopeptide (TPR) repeat protein
MAHEVFISHSSLDKPVADAVCAALENAAIRCWIAPRDLQPGRSFAGEITRAIQRSKVMVLIFSAHSNTSEQILREVQLAANSHLHIVQFRIADVNPNDDLEYYLSAPHWLDALTPPLEDNLQRLGTSVKALLEMAAEEPAEGGMMPVAPLVDFRAEKSQLDSVATAKDPTTPAKSTQTTRSQPPISPAASISAIAASKEPALWRRKRLIIVTAGGTTVLLLIAITALLTRPHPPVRKAASTSPEPVLKPAVAAIEEMYNAAYKAFDSNKFSEALKQLDAIDARQPDLAASKNLRGVILIRQGNYDQAETALLEAAKIDPKFWNARFNLAEIPFLKKDWPEARKRFEQLLSTDLAKEATQMIQYKIFLTYLMEGKGNMADSIWAKLELSPDTPVVDYVKAAVALQQKNQNEAKYWINAAEKNFSPQLNKLFAESLYEVGLLEKPAGTASTSPEPVFKPAVAATPTSFNTASPEPVFKPAVAATPTSINTSSQVAIFGYHRLVDPVRYPGTEITPSVFEAQMKQLQDSGVAVISLQDFLAWRRREKDIPSSCAIITLDDGWKSQYEIAWPILKRFGYPFTMFIYTEGVRGGSLGGSEAITWEQLAEMRDAGVDIEAHSATHQDLREGHNIMLAEPGGKRTRTKLTGAEYEQWVQNEVVGCKVTIERRLRVRVNCFAVPYGFYNEHIKEIAKNAGYEALFTVYGQNLTFYSPLDACGRYAIEANKPQVFTAAVSNIRVH